VRYVLPNPLNNPSSYEIIAVAYGNIPAGYENIAVGYENIPVGYL
jgi:hypothetical protein